MPYDLVDANKDIEVLAAQNDFLMRVVQKLDEFVIKGGNKSVLESVREEMQSETTKEEEPEAGQETVQTKKKGGRPKSSFV